MNFRKRLISITLIFFCLPTLPLLYRCLITQEITPLPDQLFFSQAERTENRNSSARGPRTTKPDQAGLAHISEDYNQLPLRFEANHGQADSSVKFLSRCKDFDLLLTATEAVMTLSRPAVGKLPRNLTRVTADIDESDGNSKSDVLRMKLAGANPTSEIVGVDELPGKSNYFIGNEPGKWQVNIPNFARVKYEGVYPGVDMVYYGDRQQLEYDFIVSPGADAKSISLSFSGAEGAYIGDSGDLVLQTSSGEVHQHKPFAYQEAGGTKKEIGVRYHVGAGPEVTFDVDEYDASKALIIDPVMDVSTFLGGSGNDQGISVAVDTAGNVYLTGLTRSPNFPMAKQTPFELGAVFVAKLDATGKSLIYSTVLSSRTNSSVGTDLAIDPTGNVYVTGKASFGFPTTPGALVNTPLGREVFALKLNPTGNRLLYSTFLGAEDDLSLRPAIAIDSQGNAYLTGETGDGFPTTPGAFQTTGDDEAFVTKLNATGSALIYSTYLGGSNTDIGYDIAVDDLGYAYVTGETLSSNFPLVNALQPTLGGFVDAFISKINLDGSGLVYSTYLGGSIRVKLDSITLEGDVAFAIAVDRSHNVYVGGHTYSPDFPITPGAFQTTKVGLGNGFISKLNSSGDALVYSTYLGGGGESINALAVDEFGNCYAGGSAQENFPTTPDALERLPGGGVDAFISKLNAAGTALVYSSYLGGSDFDEGIGIALDPFGNAYVTGRTDSDDFPVTGGSFQKEHGKNPMGSKNEDVFVTKVILSPPKITGASMRGKKLFVFGGNFDEGAVILINGEGQKTVNDEDQPQNSLIGKNVGKKIARGSSVTLQVRNSDGTLSNEFSFTRPALE